ncbi:MAG: flagellar biosynthesis protein FlgA, partial [Defluviitaleaceae bacterium]|nr:flagellar biosynthesis protein FlgA [Defluviitaleaceae bacterium]
DSVYGLLNSYYLRRQTFLYKDQLIGERPQRNEWLYNLSDDHEIITIPYNNMEAGGNILVPGDRIRIRVIYETPQTAESGSIYDTNPYYFPSSSNKQMASEVLFESIVITDMINANAHSIYEVYNEVMRLDETRRLDVMKSSAFMANIKPRALLLAATPDQVEAYAKFKNIAGSGSFLITILSRSGSEIILDKLPTLESEVNSWLK